MSAFFERVTIFCFAASYGIALALELWHLAAPRPVLRLVSLGFGAAGLLAHTFFVLAQPLALATPLGSLLFLAWIVAVFYLYGSIHHYRQAWGLFVLPLVLGLVALAAITAPPAYSDGGQPTLWADVAGDRFWAVVHGILVLLASVGICVGFVASVMYLVQVGRLRAKLPPGQGIKMMSLERLESMNRKAILWAFPLLTAGLIVGVALQWQQGQFLAGWESPKILSSLGLWLVFAILLYLRYGAHARGRQTALLTLLAFAILICTLLSPVHPFVHGGGGP
jgi:ABC-type transport system involved in cytochrome c biogenesis permease subunit